jgi:hypothetical protein
MADVHDVVMIAILVAAEFCVQYARARKDAVRLADDISVRERRTAEMTNCVDGKGGEQAC